MIRRIGLLCLLAPLLAGAKEEAKQEQTPTVETLVRATRNIDTDEESIRSLAFRLRFPDTHWGIGLRRRAPDEIEFLLRDTSDETPLAFQSGTRLMLYDPLEGKLLRCDTSRIDLFLGVEEQEFQFNFSLRPMPVDPEETPRPHRIRLGVRDLLDATRPDRVTRVLDDDHHALIGVTPRSRTIVAFEIDLEREWPCVGLMVRDPNKPEPQFKIERIRVNEEPGDERIRRFDFDSLDSEFVVEPIELELATEEQVETAVACLVRGVLVRTALSKPPLRASVESGLGRKLDWESIAKQDGVLAPRLRSLFSE